MNETGHDLQRVRLLRARTVDALEELKALRTTDPAAGAAMQVVRLTEHTLERFWLPALEELDPPV